MNVTTLRKRFATTLAVAVLVTAIFNMGIATAQSAGAPDAAANATVATTYHPTPTTTHPTTTVPYPPPSTTLPKCHGIDIDAGVVVVGQTITFTLCGPFLPGVTLTISLDGRVVGVKIASGNGAVTIVITITSIRSGLIHGLLRAPIGCGKNVIVAVGAGVTSAVAVRHGTFTLRCPAADGRAPVALNGTKISRNLNQSPVVYESLLAALLLLSVGGGLLFARRKGRTHAA